MRWHEHTQFWRLEELLVKVLAAHLVEPQVIIQELKCRQQIHQERLGAYLEKETGVKRRSL
jgi:hypothetical protein